MPQRGKTPIVLLIAVWLATVWLATVLWLPQPTADAEPLVMEADIEVFTRAGCPRCQAAHRFLTELQRERPHLRIVEHDIEKDATALTRLHDLVTRHGGGVIGVPAFVVRGTLLIGYHSDTTTGLRLRTLLDTPLKALPPTKQSAANVCGPDTSATCVSEPTSPPVTEDEIEVPWLGPLRVDTFGLPLFTVVIGLLDGFNPCAMWMLLFLLSLLVNLRDRAKMLLIGGVFILVSGLVYFAFMAAWLNVFLTVGFSRVTQVILGVVALVVGLVNSKDFFALGRGVSLSIPDSAKPGIYARVRRIIQAENVAGSLVSVIALAVLVNMVELLCTAGFPAVYTHVLTLRQLPWWVYYGYLGLYNLAYMLDDTILLLIGVVTLSRRKLQEREGRWLKLLSGIVMSGLGVTLLVKPEWLVW
ncbi:MAG: NrdH-redoxin [Deltaproteobacteria bacterium]|nr:NrdH-redoxin [Deltaproteobacteria bacterium]